MTSPPDAPHLRSLSHIFWPFIVRPFSECVPRSSLASAAHRLSSPWFYVLVEMTATFLSFPVSMRVLSIRHSLFFSFSGFDQRFPPFVADLSWYPPFSRSHNRTPFSPAFKFCSSLPRYKCSHDHKIFHNFSVTLRATETRGRGTLSISSH